MSSLVLAFGDSNMYRRVKYVRQLFLLEIFKVNIGQFGEYFARKRVRVYSGPLKHEWLVSRVNHLTH